MFELFVILAWTLIIGSLALGFIFEYLPTSIQEIIRGVGKGLTS